MHKLLIFFASLHICYMSRSITMDPKRLVLPALVAIDIDHEDFRRHIDEIEAQKQTKVFNADHNAFLAKFNEIQMYNKYNKNNMNKCLFRGTKTNIT